MLVATAPAAARPGHLDRSPLLQGTLAAPSAGTVLERAPLVHAADAASAPTWCGPEIHTDDRRDAVFAKHTVKLLYAYPAGRPDRFGYWAPILQANVGVMTRYMARESLGEKTVRFDLGTSCGPQYVDIQTLRLRRRTAAYMDGDGLPTVDVGSRLWREIRAATRGERGHNYLVFVDGLNQIAPGDPLWAWGMTDELIADSRPGQANRNNRPGRISAVFGPDRGLPPQLPLGFDSTMFMHELLHGLGAVQSNAPHATAGGHCYDGTDIMCYDDGTLHSAAFTEADCPQIGGEIYQALDCHNDDYFSPTPPPAGSYLASHWNVVNSRFLGSCADARLSAACSG